MLTEQDLKFISDNRKQLTQGRTTPVILTYKVEQGVDEWTGEPMEEILDISVEAVVTEIATASDLEINSGIMEDKIDLQLSISLDQLEGYETERPSYVTYYGKKYAVNSVDREGIGAVFNRLEITAKKV